MSSIFYFFEKTQIVREGDMKFNFTVLTLVFLFLFACSPSEPLTQRTSTPVPTSTKKPTDITLTSQNPIPTATAIPTITIAIPTSTPQGETILVTSADDNGLGTFRQALLDAKSGDIITFDPTVFPPDDPVTILLKNKEEHSALPHVIQGGLTIDASNAGVIIDGSNTTGDWVNGLEIYSSGNIVQGLQIINFTGSGVALCSGSNNVIGGDRKIGSGPIGQGNLSSNNGNGIDLCDWGSHNTVTGNIIGTNTTGSEDWGNTLVGICIEKRMTENVIGPDNVIAFNDQYGILITDKSTTGNTIIKNSIFDNEWGGINLSEGNANLSPPEIISFDLVAGTLRGETCALCTIEVFSGKGDQGSIYEGETEADEKGNFILNKETAFSGPYLTAIVTDMDGNSSAFSTRTFGLASSSILQEGNKYPLIKLVWTPYQELEDNHIIHQNPVGPDQDTCPPVEDNYRLQEVFQLGTKWMRIQIDAGEMESHQLSPYDWYSTNEITEYQDCTISLLHENGVTLINTLNYWDEEHVLTETLPDYGNADEVQRFLEHNRFIISHFKGRIQYYEILNEPNTPSYVDVKDYISLVRQTIPIVHEEDPSAKIVVGAVNGLAGTDSREYLFEILRSDIMPLVDGVSIHPMYGTSPQYEEIREYYYYYPMLIQEIKDIARAHGYQGEFIASEMTWGTPEHSDPASPWLYPYTVAAKYYARAIVTNIGMDVWAGVARVTLEEANPFIGRTIRNLSEVMAGAESAEITFETLTEQKDIKSYSFSLPNGDHLIAIWLDNVAAVDYDPGMSAAVKISGYAGWNVTGIDTLYGFEKELITSSENGDLVINNFLLKDYPMIIRLLK